jgi:hypothetical protein
MKQFISLLIVFLFFTSCTEEGAQKKKSNSPSSERIMTSGVYIGNSKLQYTGKAGELVIVCDNTIFTDEIFVALDSVFGDYIKPYYPPEKRFTLLQMNQDRYNKIGKRVRNLMRLEINNKIEKGDPQVIVKKDFYSRTQILTEILAHDNEDLLLAADHLLSDLANIYDQQEWNREYIRHKEENNTIVRRNLSKQFGITLDMPRQGKYESIKSSFARISFPDRSRQMDIQADGGFSSAKANFIQSGIMIWSFDYKDSSQLAPAYLMKARDTILKYNALHEIEGVYMGTQDHPAVIPVHNRLKIGDIEGYEFRGLYKFTGRFEPSGGKFWSFHFKHPTRKKIIAVSAYLDAPPTMSSSMDIRRLQAILYSLKITE